MTPRLPVSLHISLAPRDLRHARVLLPHQLRVVGPVVEEVVLTIDTQGVPASSAGADYAELHALAAQASDVAPKFVVRVANYDAAHRRELSARLFERGVMPRQTYRVGPFHAYFDGWAATTQPYLFHLDSDMLLGGALSAWLPEAIALLRSDRTVFTCTPLGGPPRPDFRINQPSRRDDTRRGAHVVPGFSTRIFFLERERLLAPQPKFKLAPAAWRNRLRGWAERTSAQALPEDLIGEHMRQNGLRRIDFLGTEPGCWSLHPPYRNAEFYRRLDEVVRRVECGDLPEAQRGDFDLNDSMIDWSDAREALARNRWWRRWRPFSGLGQT